MQAHLAQLLQELEKTASIYWNISPETGAFLNKLIKDRQYQTALEVGTSNGYSGIWLAEALSHTSGMLYTIESHYKERYHLATDNFEKSGLQNHITQILGHAPEAIPQSPQDFDFAFFDATKREHINYFKSIAPRILPGGTIIADNILSHQDQMSDYIQEVRTMNEWTSTILNIGTGLMISHKKLKD